MKFLKMTQTSTMEMVMPIGDPSQKEIDDILSEKGRAEFKEIGRKELEDQASAASGKILDFDLIIEVIEV